MKNQCRRAPGMTIGCSALVALVAYLSASAQPPGPDNAQDSDERRVLSTSATEQGVTITIECPETIVSGAVNYITIIVRNEGDRSIQFYPIAPQRACAGFEVSRQAMPVERTALGKRALEPSLFPGFRPPVRIDKGQEIRAVVNLTRYYDLSLPAYYDIVAVWSGWSPDNEQRIRIETKPLKFQVVVERGESVILVATAPHCPRASNRAWTCSSRNVPNASTAT
jgi:hypothetical protein